MRHDELDEHEEGVEQKEYSKEQQEYMAKLLGCSRDHGKEIDLYNKSYADKIEQIGTHLKYAEADSDPATSEADELQRKAYYY